MYHILIEQERENEWEANIKRRKEWQEKRIENNKEKWKTANVDSTVDTRPTNSSDVIEMFVFNSWKWCQRCERFTCNRISFTRDSIFIERALIYFLLRWKGVGTFNSNFHRRLRTPSDKRDAQSHAIQQTSNRSLIYGLLIYCYSIDDNLFQLWTERVGLVCRFILLIYRLCLEKRKARNV